MTHTLPSFARDDLRANTTCVKDIVKCRLVGNGPVGRWCTLQRHNRPFHDFTIDVRFQEILIIVLHIAYCACVFIMRAMFKSVYIQGIPRAYFEHCPRKEFTY